MEQCGVPKEVEFQTKAQLGLEMIREAQKREMPYAFIGMDTHYGQQPWLLAELEADEECYIADIPYDTRVWQSCPETQIPKRKGNRGRLPTERKLGKVNPLPLKSVKLPRRFLHLHGSKSMSGIHNVDNFGHESHA